MPNLTRAHDELFRRTPDEVFPSLQALAAHCDASSKSSSDYWRPPTTLKPVPNGDLKLSFNGSESAHKLCDWSFTQLCGQARASRDTMNRLSPATAALALSELLPTSNKPLQLYVDDEKQLIRSIHGTAYTRLFNSDIVRLLKEYTDFSPPQQGMTGGTGLYCGEQDLFCFLIDPTGWTEIDGEAFAPGFFVWNSEVGKRTVGVSTFWFQAVCKNHIVWDATDVVEWTRKHTSQVSEAIPEIRKMLDSLVARRDERRDGFVNLMKKAMGTSFGSEKDEVLENLLKNGIGKGIATRALELAKERGRFTIFSLVDALTRLAQECEFAGERVVAEQKAGALLQLAA